MWVWIAAWIGLRPLPVFALVYADLPSTPRLAPPGTTAHSPQCGAALVTPWRLISDKDMKVNPGTKEKNVMIISKVIMPTATTHTRQADWHNPVDLCMR